MNADPSYDFDPIGFKPGDVVIDIGGNIGMVSIYLARKYPFLKIYAFEPAKLNYECFVKNLKLHNLTNVIVENKAVTSDGRDVELMYDPTHPTCSTTTSNLQGVYKKLYPTGAPVIENVQSITLDEIFSKHGLKECKLLKIDCEGAEFEILYNTKMLGKIEHIRGEVHELDASSLNGPSLIAHCEKSVLKENVKLTAVRLA